ncbi:MAG: 2TM domain-containing protein [Hyphomicrobiaceae bacterium]|nr:MAG: 2TM domain-containing protein [Hyphomicrobiaceae bacterium]
MDEFEKRARAKQQIEAIKGFYLHAIIFTLVILILFFVNWRASDVWWVQWPLLGWGLGLCLHALLVFGRVPGFVSRWEERKMKELTDKM